MLPIQSSQAVGKLLFLLKILCNARPILFRRGELGKREGENKASVIIIIDSLGLTIILNPVISHFPRLQHYNSIQLEVIDSPESAESQGQERRLAPPLTNKSNKLKAKEDVAKRKSEDAKILSLSG